MFLSYICVMRVLGVMSGSSMDAIDVVSVYFDDSNGLSWQLEHSKAFAMPEELKVDLSKVNNQKALGIAKTESAFSLFISQCIAEFREDIAEQVDLVSIHGHTLLHIPDISASWQLLNGGMVAALTRLKVICDFRNQDMALGGQGTPMAVIADRDLYPGYDYYLNMGGIANISYLKNEQWCAYDIAPCNQVNNYYAQKLGLEFDESGHVASRGKVHNVLLDRLLKDDYIQKEFPKSIDNSWIKEYWIPLFESFDLSPRDSLRTNIEFLVNVLEKEVSHLKGSILFSGGGVKNSFFINEVKRLQQIGYSCVVPDGEIIDFKESVLMAYMGYLRMKGQNNFISSATGAERDCLGGAIYTS